jgi:hypothetical protein
MFQVGFEPKIPVLERLKTARNIQPADYFRLRKDFLHGVSKFQPAHRHTLFLRYTVVVTEHEEPPFLFCSVDRENLWLSEVRCLGCRTDKAGCFGTPFYPRGLHTSLSTWEVNRGAVPFPRMERAIRDLISHFIRFWSCICLYSRSSLPTKSWHGKTCLSSFYFNSASSSCI